MARWLVKLNGNPFDLEEYVRWFPNGDIHAVSIDGETFLTGEGFNSFTTPTQVRDEALAALDDFSAVIALLWDALERPTVDGKIVHEDDNGKSATHAIIKVETARIRVKASGKARVITASGEERTSDEKTQAQQLLELARKNSGLQLVLALWADPVRTWPRLYLVYEVLEKMWSFKSCTEGLGVGKDLDRFTHTANAPGIAGKDSRHAVITQKKFVPPENPMPLNEATALIGRLITAILQHS